MSKYSKSGYAKHTNFNNFMNATHSKFEGSQSREGTRAMSRNSELDRNTPTASRKKEQRKAHKAIQRKIDIDPTLLLSHKANSKQDRFTTNSRLNTGFRDRKTVSREGMYRAIDTEGNYNAFQRPQSKQQSRVKVSSRLDKSSGINAVERPQTSKGQRNVYHVEDINRYPKNGHFQEDNHNSIEMKINFKSDGKQIAKHPMSAVTRKPQVSSRKMSFQTSLDPQFLALFAS